MDNESGRGWIAHGFKALLGIGISAALIGWMISITDWSQVASRMGDMRWYAFVPVLIATIVHYMCRAYRWPFILPEGKTYKFRNLFDAFLVGCFATFVLPFRAGEFVRPFMLTKYSGTPFPTAFVSIVVERFFDLLVVLGTFGLLLVLAPAMPAEIRYGAVILAGLAATIFLFMVAATYCSEILLKLLAYCLKPFPASFSRRVLAFVSDFIIGAAVLKHKGRLVKVILLSIVVWLTNFIQFYTFYWIFGEDPSFLISVTTAVMVALAVAAPSAPGFIGVYQGGCIIGFKMFGLPLDLAVAFSIVTHVFQYVVIVCYGCYVLMRDGLSLRDLRKR